jgi:putative DNA primase/helicase
MPRVSEFIAFIKLLGQSAPDLVPWLIRLNPAGKDPIEGVSWKDPTYGRLTIYQAIDYMKHGGNVGIAGTDHDNLVMTDCDGGIIQANEVKSTLMVKTRSRIGKHAYNINIDTPKIPNIPTDEAGEVRSIWQFVVAPGSYVPVTDTKKLALIPLEELKEDIGYYTICNPIAPTTLTYSELPKFFREVHEKKKEAPIRTPVAYNPKKATGKHSALFDITAEDVCRKEGGCTTAGERWYSLFHDSDSGKNMSLSDQGLLQCWRHSCSFNGLQALVVLSGYMSCDDAGSHHKGTIGSSNIIGDYGAIFHAWKYAYEHGYLPKGDSIPCKALAYLAEKEFHYKVKKNAKDEPEMLPTNVYREVLRVLKEKY